MNLSPVRIQDADPEAPGPHKVVFELPRLFSVNGMRLPRGNRLVNSPKYRKFKKEVQPWLCAQRVPIFLTDSKHRYSLHINVKPNRTGDIDNYYKCVPDLLQTYGILQDDKWCIEGGFRLVPGQSQETIVILQGTVKL